MTTKFEKPKKSHTFIFSDSNFQCLHQLIISDFPCVGDGRPTQGSPELGSRAVLKVAPLFHLETNVNANATRPV